MPDDFPNNSIMVDIGEDKNGIPKLKLPDKYRVGETQADFDNLKYFFSRMVVGCNATTHEFRHGKAKKRVSKIFSVSDEAYALLVIYNEVHRWKVDAEKDANKRVVGTIQNRTPEQQGQSGEKRKRESPRERKRFTDSGSGDKEGWSLEGRKLYQELCKRIEELRQIPCTGEMIEERMRKTFAMEDGIDTEIWTNTTELDSRKAELGGYVPGNLKLFFAEV